MQFILFFVLFLFFLHPLHKGFIAGPKHFGRLLRGDLLLLPGGYDIRERIRLFLRKSPEVYSLCSRSRDSLCLSLPDELSFRLCHIAQQLQNNVRDQGTDQIPILTGIQQRHIQHHNFCAFFLCYQSPLFNDLIIVSPESVDTLYYKCVSGFDFLSIRRYCGRSKSFPETMSMKIWLLGSASC